MVEQYIMSVLEMSFFGNELWRYLAFVGILLVFFPLSKLCVFLLEKVLTKWAESTEFRFDDILIKSLNPPVSMFVLAGLFYLAKSYVGQGILQEFFDQIFSFLIIIPFVYFLIKFSTEMMGYYLKHEDVKGKSKHINEAAVDLLMTVTKVALVIIGILLILSNLGYNVSALLAGLGVGGLAFALAAQSLLGNFFAGVALIFDKAFNKGDRVRFQGYNGIIEQVNLRSTKLRTYDGELLTIPNSLLADNIVENVTKVPKVKVMVTIGLTYDTPAKKMEEAKKILRKIITSHKLTTGNPSIWFDNFGAYSLDIKVIFFANLKMHDWPDRVHYKDEIFMEILDQFNKAGLSFAFPTQTLDIEFRDEQLKKLGKK